MGDGETSSGSSPSGAPAPDCFSPMGLNGCSQRRGCGECSWEQLTAMNSLLSLNSSASAGARWEQQVQGENADPLRHGDGSGSLVCYSQPLSLAVAGGQSTFPLGCRLPLNPAVPAQLRRLCCLHQCLHHNLTYGSKAHLELLPGGLFALQQLCVPVGSFSPWDCFSWPKSLPFCAIRWDG